jgi:outer membrane lipoprotein
VDRSITLQDIQANPDRFVGKMVLLGGQIIATSVKKEETWVEVIEKPLDRKDKPKDTSVSHGRFLILFKGFMDPAIYSPGRKITVAGEVHGRKVLPIKEVAYSYPVIVPKEHHIWKYEEPDHGPWFSFGVGVGIH